MKIPFTRNETEASPLALAVFSIGMAFVVVAASTRPEPVQVVAKAPQAASQAWSWQGPAPLGGPADWTGVEAAPDAGPAAIAAYETEPAEPAEPDRPAASRPVAGQPHAGLSSIEP